MIVLFWMLAGFGLIHFIVVRPLGLYLHNVTDVLQRVRAAPSQSITSGQNISAIDFGESTELLENAWAQRREPADEPCSYSFQALSLLTSAEAAARL